MLGSNIAIGSKLSTKVIKQDIDAPLIWKIKNFPKLIKGLTYINVAKLFNIPIHYGMLYLTVRKANGQRINYGLVSTKLITTAAVNYIAAGFANTNTAQLANFRYHGLGTGNTAAVIGDTALQTEIGYSNGSGATATITVSGGVINGFSNISGGTGYSGGTVNLTQDSATNATATATVDANGAITALTVVNGGSGYSAGTVSIGGSSYKAVGSRGTKSGADNVYVTVGTNKPSANAAVTEHGIFRTQTGSTTMLDRSVFSVINLTTNDSLETTYELTIAAGG